MRITFPSIKETNIRYVIVKSSHEEDNSNFYNYPSACIGNTFFQFDTMGDGEVQHTPLWLVPAENIEDFTCSLALFLSENQSKEIWEILYYNIQMKGGNRKNQIKFLYGLKTPKKETWINLQECKKSTSKSKEHDKRWQKLSGDFVPDFKNIYPFFCENYYGLLDRLYLTETLRDVTNWNLYVDYEEFFKIKDFGNIRTAMIIIQNFIEAYNRLDGIERMADSLRHNLKIKEKEDETNNA